MLQKCFCYAFSTTYNSTHYHTTAGEIVQYSVCGQLNAKKEIQKNSTIKPNCSYYK